MKKLVFTLVSLFALTVNASAMSFEQAQEQALFLTDKMAYELNLTPEQYDAAYEINLDYLMGITTSEDVFNEYWTRRNLDLSYVLLDWQYRTFCDALYFYRPLYWDAGYWHFRIYARYPHRSWFYFDRPTVYISYRGEHCWRHHGDRGYYHGRVFASHGTHNHSRGQIVGGMRDSWNGKGRTFNNRHNNSNVGFRNNNAGNHNSRANGNFENRSHNNGGNNTGFGSRSHNSSNRSSFGNPSSTRETVTPRRNPSISQNKSTSTNLSRGNMVSSTRNTSISSTRNTMSTPSRSSSSSFGSSTRSMSSNSSSFSGGSRGGSGGFGSSRGGGGSRGGFSGGGHR